MKILPNKLPKKFQWSTHNSSSQELRQISTIFCQISQFLCQIWQFLCQISQFLCQISKFFAKFCNFCQMSQFFANFLNFSPKFGQQKQAKFVQKFWLDELCVPDCTKKKTQKTITERKSKPQNIENQKKIKWNDPKKLYKYSKSLKSNIYIFQLHIARGSSNYLGRWSSNIRVQPNRDGNYIVHLYMSHVHISLDMFEDRNCLQSIDRHICIVHPDNFPDCYNYRDNLKFHNLVPSKIDHRLYIGFKRKKILPRVE